MSTINLYHGDCMEAMRQMPDKAYDLAIVDPEYGIGLGMVYNHGTTKATIHQKKEWNGNIPGSEYFEQLHRVSKHQIIWGCNYYAKYIPAVGRIVHDKQLRIEGTDLKYSEADLASCSLQKRITVFRYRWNGNVQGDTINWKNEGPDRRIHPTQKPISLYKYCLQYAKPGWKILDTHGGSMAIAIACHDLGFDLDLWEIDKDYYEAGVKRFNDHKKQLNLFRA